MISSQPCTAFQGFRRLASGPLLEVALSVKTALEAGAVDPVLTFDDATGRVLDFDLSGTRDQTVERISQGEGYGAPSALRADSDAPGEPRGRGRPRLGVVGREVTLFAAALGLAGRAAGRRLGRAAKARG